MGIERARKRRHLKHLSIQQWNVLRGLVPHYWYICIYFLCASLPGQNHVGQCHMINPEATPVSLTNQGTRINCCFFSRSKGHSSSSIFFTRLRIVSGQIDVWSVLVQRYFERQQGMGEPLACWENNTIHSISRKVLDCPVTASYFLYMHAGAAHCRAIVTTPGKMTYLRRETLPIEWEM